MRVCLLPGPGPAQSKCPVSGSHDDKGRGRGKREEADENFPLTSSGTASPALSVPLLYDAEGARLLDALVPAFCTWTFSAQPHLQLLTTTLEVWSSLPLTGPDNLYSQ